MKSLDERHTNAQLNLVLVGALRDTLNIARHAPDNHGFKAFRSLTNHYETCISELIPWAVRRAAGTNNTDH